MCFRRDSKSRPLTTVSTTTTTMATTVTTMTPTMTTTRLQLQPGDSATTSLDISDTTLWSVRQLPDDAMSTHNDYMADPTARNSAT